MWSKDNEVRTVAHKIVIYWIYHTLLNCLLQQTFYHQCNDPLKTNLFVFWRSLSSSICELVCQSKLNSLGSISIRSDSRLYWISGVRTRYWWPWWCKWMNEWLKFPQPFCENSMYGEKTLSKFWFIYFQCWCFMHSESI